MCVVTLLWLHDLDEEGHEVQNVAGSISQRRATYKGMWLTASLPVHLSMKKLYVVVLHVSSSCMSSSCLCCHFQMVVVLHVVVQSYCFLTLICGYRLRSSRTVRTLRKRVATRHVRRLTARTLTADCFVRHTDHPTGKSQEVWTVKMSKNIMTV